MNEELKKKLARDWFKILQDMICLEIEKIEKNKVRFVSTNWHRNKIKDEGGGEYRILKNGKTFDKVGVNFSEVYGKFSKEFKNKIPGTKNSSKFWASGISVVMHMKNPHVPAMHFNTRYIYTSHGWFGGGVDVTPCFDDKKYKKWFHNEIKKCCDRHNKNYYKNIKFGVINIFIYHTEKDQRYRRNFFDYKNNWKKDFLFIRDVGITFKKVFEDTIKIKIKKMDEKEKETQYQKEEGMLSLIYYMIEEQNLVYKLKCRCYINVTTSNSKSGNR